MVDFSKYGSARTRLALGGAVLLALGAAGGAGAVKATRPTVEMAPASPVPIASLAQRDGIVTVKGRVAEAYGDSFVVQDASGKTMVKAGRGGDAAPAVGSAITVQGRYDDGQLRASYLVAPDGKVEAVGPGGRHGPGGPEGRDGPHGRGGPDGPSRDGPDRDGPPPPPPGCAPGATAGPAGIAPPAPVANAPTPAVPAER